MIKFRIFYPPFFFSKKKMSYSVIWDAWNIFPNVRTTHLRLSTELKTHQLCRKFSLIFHVERESTKCVPLCFIHPPALGHSLLHSSRFPCPWPFQGADHTHCNLCLLPVIPSIFNLKKKQGLCLFLNPAVLRHILQRFLESMNGQESTLMDLGLDIIRCQDFYQVNQIVLCL